MPSTVSLNAFALAGIGMLEFRVYFMGTQEQFNAVPRLSDSGLSQDALDNVVFFSEEMVDGTWYFDHNGVPVLRPVA